MDMEWLLMADLLPNGLHEKVIIFSICYVTKSRLDVQFVEKITLEIVIDQQMKEEGYDQNNGFHIKLSIHLLLKQDLLLTYYEPQVLSTHLLSKEELLSVMLWCSVYLYYTPLLNKARIHVLCIMYHETVSFRGTYCY